MKRSMIVLLAAGAAMLAGCGMFGSKEEPASLDGLAVHGSTSTPARYESPLVECARQVGAIATAAAGDAASKVAAVGALERMCSGQAQAFAAAASRPEPPGILGSLWQATLQVADLALRGYGIKANRDVNLAQSNNNRDVSIASYGAFTSMGNAIGAAGTAGYQYVQAPGAVTTTTNNTTTTSTLSGTGVLGSGTYTGPVTTTRTCTGAAGGAGSGTTTGAPGGAGGTASC